MKEIIIEVDTTGKLSVEGQGFKGKECDAKMKEFEAIGKVATRKNKPEYNQQVAINQKAGR